MSPVGLFDSDVQLDHDVARQPRRSQAGWLWAFATVSFPPAIRYSGQVAFQDAPELGPFEVVGEGASR